MIVIRHIRQQLTELQLLYNVCSERLEELNKRYAIETDVLELIKLKYQIREEMIRREETQQKMEILERKDISTRLYQALLRLNYIEQAQVFRRLTDVSQIGAFVIHGDENHGQRWLLNRLVNQVLLTPGEKPISIVFYPHRSWNFQAVLREIGKQLGRNYPASIEEIVEILYNVWQQRTIVLIFRQVGGIQQELLQKLLEKFWYELAIKATSQPGMNNQFKLLLFFVDEDGIIDTWPFECAECANTSWTPFDPIKFPRLTHIQSTELKNWIEHEWDTLPASLLDTPVEDILRQSEAGTPQLVLEHLCTLCNCDWSEVEHQWIKH